MSVNKYWGGGGDATWAGVGTDCASGTESFGSTSMGGSEGIWAVVGSSSMGGESEEVWAGVGLL